MTAPPHNQAGPEIPPQTVARVLRHGISSLLQTVYATVAILKDRLPEDWEEERRLLVGAQAQAKTCARFLDTVQDLVSPLALASDPIDLAELVGRAVETARQAHPQRTISAEIGQVPAVLGDGPRLQQTADLLLLYACDRASGQVTVRVAPATQARSASDATEGFSLHRGAGDGTDQGVEWSVADDGPSLSGEQLQRLFVPFAAPRQGLAEVGLTLAHRLIALHGGQMEAANRPEGGLCLRVTVSRAEGKNLKKP
jgi:signal transduction histidine kinase